MEELEFHKGMFAVAFVSPCILTHPTLYGEVARGSERMKRDIHPCFRDPNQYFIAVAFMEASLPQRLKMLCTILWYASLHKYNVMVYWLKSKNCDGVFPDGFQLFDMVTDDLLVGAERLQLAIHVEFWMQGWDSWKPRNHQENCKGCFLCDEFLYTDFCVDTLRNAISTALSSNVPNDLHTLWRADETHYYKAFAFNESLVGHARSWVRSGTHEYNGIACFLIDLDPRIVAESKAFSEEEWIKGTNFVEAVEFAFRDQCDQHSCDDFPLVVLTEVEHIYNALYKVYGDTLKYGPFHEEGFKAQKGSKCVTVEQHVMHYVVAAQYQILYSYKEMVGYQYLKHSKNWVETVEVSFELPAWITCYYDTTPKSVDKKVGPYYGSSRGQQCRLETLVKKNVPDLKGLATQTFVDKLPREAQKVLFNIDNKLGMGMFHKAVNDLIAMATDNKLDIQKLGQRIGTDASLHILQQNRGAHKAIQNVVKTMPGWARAVIEGPYNKYCSQQNIAVLQRETDNIYTRVKSKRRPQPSVSPAIWSKALPTSQPESLASGSADVPDPES